MLRRERRISVHGLARDPDDRVLLVPADAGWRLPGGVIEHGEAPVAAAARSLRAVADSIEIGRIASVVTEVDQADGAVWHWDRLVFTVRVEATAPGRASWVEPGQVALAPFTARALDYPGGPAMVVPASVEVPPTSAARQRFAAYGVVTDPAGRVLLSRIAPGFPGADHWHLPGGGTDFGEDAEAGFLRELIEESDQRGRVTGLLAVSHRHQPREFGPEGVPLDWHAVRIVFRAEVASSTPPQVIEEGGSTAASAWFTPAAALAQPLTEIAREMIGHLA